MGVVHSPEKMYEDMHNYLQGAPQPHCCLRLSAWTALDPPACWTVLASSALKANPCTMHVMGQGSSGRPLNRHPSVMLLGTGAPALEAQSMHAQL